MSTSPSHGHRRARGDRGQRHPALLGGLVVLIVAGLSGLGMLSARLEERSIAGDANAVAIPARQWLDAYARGLVLTDDGFRARLVQAGWDSGRVATPASCPRAACSFNWLVATPAMRVDLPDKGPIDAALNGSTPIAVFGSGGDWVEIRHPGVRTSEQIATELRARTTVGQALSRLPRIAADPEVRALLDSGQVDPRVLAMLAMLAQRGTIRVLELPAVRGEDAAGQPRRQMLLAIPPDGAGSLTQFFAAQSGPYRPVSVSQIPTGLLVGYPPVAPPDLLDAFDGP
ncbi:MAG: hypothetical protein JO100_02370 [Pseudonocardia sp.]|nr:hypothetical protein [Pseudonocardia sp.]